MYQGYYGEQHISKCDTNELKHKTKKKQQIFKKCYSKYFFQLWGKTCWIKLFASFSLA